MKRTEDSRIYKEFPILEYDETKKAIIEPTEQIKPMDIPEHAVLIFFHEVIDKYHKEGRLKVIHSLETGMGPYPIYEFSISDKKIVVFHPGLGASLAVGLLEELIALGIRKVIAVGVCGVLRKDIVKDHLIIPTAAIRDEGTSYHYLPPSREVRASEEVINIIEKNLIDKQIPFLKGKTWTTDAFYRETREKLALRVAEGCLTVEMETAAFFALAKFRNIKFGQILYGGDDLSGKKWDARDNISGGLDVRERLFKLSMEICLQL